MDIYTTQGLPAHRKLQYWNAMSSEVFTALEVRAGDSAAFEGRLQRTTVGPLSLMNLASSAARVMHTRRHIAAARRDSYLLLSPQRGRMECRAGGGVLVLEPGDFGLVDHTEPYCIEHGDGMLALCIDIPHLQLAQRLPSPRRLVGRRFRPDSSVNRLLGTLLQELGRELQRQPLSQLPEALSEGLLAMLGTAEEAQGATLPAPLLHERILGWARSRLGDPELSPQQVAAHFRISDRYLRRLLAAEGLGFSAWLLEQRLALAASRLRDPAWRSATILEVALACGFSNATHFGQSFRRRHGCTPRDYRAACVA